MSIHLSSGEGSDGRVHDVDDVSAYGHPESESCRSDPAGGGRRRKNILPGPEMTLETSSQRLVKRDGDCDLAVGRPAHLKTPATSGTTGVGFTNGAQRGAFSRSTSSTRRQSRRCPQPGLLRSRLRKSRRSESCRLRRLQMSQNGQAWRFRKHRGRIVHPAVRSASSDFFVVRRK